MAAAGNNDMATYSFSQTTPFATPNADVMPVGAKELVDLLHLDDLHVIDCRECKVVRT